MSIEDEGILLISELESLNSGKCAPWYGRTGVVCARAKRSIGTLKAAAKTSLLAFFNQFRDERHLLATLGRDAGMVSN